MLSQYLDFQASQLAAITDTDADTAAFYCA